MSPWTTLASSRSQGRRCRMAGPRNWASELVTGSSHAATGQFGGAAVEVALAVGEDVVICRRKGDVLDRIKSALAPVDPQGEIDVVRSTGTVGRDVTTIMSLNLE
ncbi:uncharacterized protein PV07_09432, partial [Cladophialophora immunda]